MTNLTSVQTPAEWLLEQYDNAGLSLPSPDEYGHVVIQPIYTLKNPLDAGHPMRVTAADYRDSMRRQL
jgi:hypothetical protein